MLSHRLPRFGVALAMFLPLAACSEDAPSVAWRNRPVIGGAPTPAGKFPAIGALVIADEGPYCTGTLIRPDVVLTAAHCLLDGPPLAIIRFTLSNDAVSAPEIVGVRRVVTHEGFHLEPFPGPTLGQVNDIGLVFLSAPITGVAPVQLPTVAEAAGLTSGMPITLVGYGVTEVGGDSAGVKYDAVTELVTVSEFELQLSKPGQPQNCFGDSGGPALAALGDGERVVGIVSRGASDVDHPECDQGGIDTRVDAFLGWIEQQLAVATPDAGVPAPDAAIGPDAATAPDAGGSDASPPALEDEAGCSCQAARRGGRTPAGSLVLALFVAGVLFARRRRAAAQLG